MPQLSIRQHVSLWASAAIIGLVLAALLNASWLASAGLVAAVGILIGIGAGAREQWQRSHDGSTAKRR